MEVWERRLAEARRRAPKALDFDALLSAHQQRNDAMAADWRQRHPDSPYAVLEIRIFASGHSKRRLRRYSEMINFRTRTPGLLVSRSTLTLEWMTLATVQMAAAAARAEVTNIDWTLLTVTEALAATP